MTTWVSQAEAVRLLAALGDQVSQQGLSQYLKGHPEVIRQDNGPGRAQKIDWESLKDSRGTRLSRGPASQPEMFANEAPPPPVKPEKVEKSPESIDLGARRARADTDRAEADARRARILADEAEGRMISRDAAVNAFVVAGVALVRAMEENRVLTVEEIRAAPETREALAAMTRHERMVRTRFANALTDFASSSPELAAAE